ncbi:MAG: Mut7-C RNAse domain-containing protein [Cyanobacteria bacterium P01_D01_bin.115]
MTETEPKCAEIEPKPTVFFIDRCLGSVKLATALRKAGISVEIHDEHFPQNAEDESWLPEVGERGWVVLTKDKNIAKRTSERLAVASANIRMFVLAVQNLPGQDMIEVFLKAFMKMQTFARENPSPFIAKVYKTGEVSEWKNHEELLTKLNDMTRSMD